MFKKVRKGQSLVEYGLILALVAVIAIAALNIIGARINNAATTSGSNLENAASNSSASYCQSIGMELDTSTGLCKSATSN